jgi:hypothetical protein
VLAAIACGRDSFTEIDFAIFDAQILGELGIESIKIDGETPDSFVNELHLDLPDLTADEIFELAKAIKNHGEIDRVLGKEVKISISKGIDEGYLQPEKMNQILYGKLK